MSAPENFEQVGTRGFFRPVGVVTFEQALDLMIAGLEYARSLGLKDVVVNIQGLTGFPPPSTFARYAMAVRGAQSGGGVVRVAVITRPEIIDPQKIGVVMAQNRGLDADVFTVEADGIRWLDSRAGVRP
jgi:hypothetical protein